eukprot:CAMPEP_0194211828 /NCGR_PEP_ID=MMETSP0156-20130528/11262_1 /TAXON_ID=33649 /ORGANISM="Thalassionema nitzschioides, Strain L26-B" /LENGTH=107 /DNA_ID=CAMNT_0038939507 /DNA_START=172 /DNA_END=492 /DNA_ORIENTATION=-
MSTSHRNVRNRRKPKSAADDARSVTKALVRTQALLQQELERVSHVSNAINEDGNVLTKTKTHQETMNDTAKGANAALRNLKIQLQKEKLVLILSFTFFFAVAFYVLW